MPVDALPESWPEPLPGTAPLRREYRDILGRPLRGVVTITGSTRTEDDGRVILPLAVNVELVGGVLEVDLPPDTYTLSAALRSVDGSRSSDAATVTL